MGKLTDRQPVLRLPIKNRPVHSPEETAALAKALARLLRPGDAVACYGELGAGKTFFIREACRALGVRQPVTSPTFTLLNQYVGRDGLQIYHFDFYRLEHPEELGQLGIDEFFYIQAIVFIEWPERIGKWLPVPRYEVHINFLPEEPQGRTISIDRIAP